MGTDVLEKLRLKVTPPNRFNDPFELRPKTPPELTREKASDALSEDRVLMMTYKQGLAAGTFSGSYEEFRAFISDHSEVFAAGLISGYPSSAANFRSEHVETISTEFGFLCLSEVPDDILMWSHYSDRHTGFVIGLDTSLPFFASPPLQQVQYFEERALVEHSVKKDDPVRAEQVNALIRRKSPHWQYEKEWRQLHFLATCVKDENSQLRLARFYMPIEPLLIREVFVGCRTSDALANHLRRLLVDPKFSHVKLRRLIIHESDFRLVPNE
jgi:hypothetical protein